MMVVDSILVVYMVFAFMVNAIMAGITVELLAVAIENSALPNSPH